ncbi:MAG TPA: hypothetical protein VFZ66_21885 [Herpetosiphonaceae bacterium]
MLETSDVIELELTPIPPDTIASGKAEIQSIIEAALREHGQTQLLADEQIQVGVEKTFPTDAVIIVGLTFVSQLAIETYKAVILPALRRRFEVRQRSKRKRRTGKKN